METKKKPEAPKTRGWYTHMHACTRMHAHTWEKKPKHLTWLPKFTHVYYKCVKKAFLHASIMNKGVSRRAEDKDGYGWGGGVKSERVCVGGRAKRRGWEGEGGERRGLGGKKRKGRHLGFPAVTDGRGRKKATDTLHLSHCLRYLPLFLLSLSFALCRSMNWVITL